MAHHAESTAIAGADDTLPKILRRNARIFANRPAMRHKDLGIWHAWTWAQMREEIVLFALGLHELGVRRHDKVAIVGSNRPRLYWGMSAVQHLGAIPVPVYADSVADEMGFVLEHADVVLAVVEDQEQVDKILSISERLPGLRSMVYDEPRGLRDYDHARLKSFADVQQLGREVIARDPAALPGWRGRSRPPPAMIWPFSSIPPARRAAPRA